jgi:hypothetical protein
LPLSERTIVDEAGARDRVRAMEALLEVKSLNAAEPLARSVRSLRRAVELARRVTTLESVFSLKRVKRLV